VTHTFGVEQDRLSQTHLLSGNRSDPDGRTTLARVQHAGLSLENNADRLRNPAGVLVSHYVAL
jgi:hypothetical protein